MTNPYLASTFRAFEKLGKAGFYTGRIAEAIVKVCQDQGGLLELADLENHMALRTQATDPISLRISSHSKSSPNGYIYGVMGGSIQPQGHVQVLLNMLRFGMKPQTALDAPRICISAFETAWGGNGILWLEGGIEEHTVSELRRLGHTVALVEGHKRSVFRRGQVIRCSRDEGIGALWQE